MSRQLVSNYTFGDTTQAAERLRILAEIYEPSSREFLKSLRERRPRRIADLGCGPGYTTRLLTQVFPDASLVGVDSSPSFVERGNATAIDRASFVVSEVSQPLPGGPYDLIYARYLLPHLPDFRGAVLEWANHLTDSGAIASEENDWIETSQPAIRQYLSIVTSMLADRDQRLDVGTELDAVDDWSPLTKIRSELVPIVVPEQTAARMFVPNLDVWRAQPFVQANYSDVEIERLKADILAIAAGSSEQATMTFGRRRIVWVRSAS